MENKKLELQKLWEELAQNTAATKSIKIRKGRQINVGYVNQFSKHNFIPNKWFDWENKTNADIMIIGQDWGPYSALLPYIDNYEKLKDHEDFDYDRFLFSTFSSRTEKFIIKAIENTYKEKFKKCIDSEIWDRFFFTVAIMFTRQGSHFRGNEFFDEKLGIAQSLPYLLKQIEIIKPKVIMPLGGIAWHMLNEIFQLGMKDSISEIIMKQDSKVIMVDGINIIPNFHPASHTDPKIQLSLWERVWDYI